MRTTTGILLLALPIALLSSCADSPKKSEPPSAPGVADTNPGDQPAPARVIFDDLDYNSDTTWSYNGKLFTGEAREFFDGTEQLRRRTRFRDGLYDGLSEEWYEDGQKKVMTRFKAGKRHGMNQYWREDGTRLKEQLYEEDHVLEEHEYDENDKVIAKPPEEESPRPVPLPG